MKTAQNTLNGQRRRIVPPELDTTLRSVRQDKRAKQSARIATTQAARNTKDMRAHPKNNKHDRTQKGSEHKRQTVPLTIWVKPGVKEELQRIAESEGLSISATGSAFLEAALQQNIYTRQTALLDPIIDTSIQKHMRSYSNRLAVLLVRSIFAGEQTRALVTNILGRQQGVSQNVLESILNGSSDTAKRNITRVTPQLTNLINKVEQWIREGESITHEQ